MSKSVELCFKSDLKHARARIAGLETELAEARKDTERLEKMERLIGYGLLSDDFGHWAVSGSGMQNIPENPPASATS